MKKDRADWFSVFRSSQRLITQLGCTIKGWNIPILHWKTTGAGGIERRRHKRYQLKYETFAFFGEYTGTLIDISTGGLAVHCAVVEKEPILPGHIDIFVATPTFYHLADFPCLSVGATQTVPASVYDRLMVKRFSLQFGPLTHEQLARLEHFIADNGVFGT
jgi:PilZ domain.